MVLIVFCALARRNRCKSSTSEAEDGAREEEVTREIFPLVGLKIVNGPIAPTDVARRKWRPRSIGR